jgi:hypothetical protein
MEKFPPLSGISKLLPVSRDFQGIPFRPELSY